MQGIGDLRIFTCWVMIERSEDGEDGDEAWIGHCLEFDIVSQGDSPQQAIDMIHEATAMALLDDLNDGAEPNDVRSKAPVEYWQVLLNIMRNGERIPLEKIRSGERGDVKKFAMQIVLPFVRVHEMELADTPQLMDSVFSMRPMQQLAC